MDQFNYFLPFGKVDKTEDGVRTLTGYASTTRLDLDGEIVSTDAIKAALPGYMDWKNIRQMHQQVAVGTAREAHVDDEGLYLTARIVDPACIKLIDEEVLKGFSIGGKKLAKKGNVITSIDLIEISVVDRPANPDCRFDVQKAAKDVGMGKAIIVEDAPASESEIGWFRKTFERIVFGKIGEPIEHGRTADDTRVSTQAPGDLEYTELLKREFSTKEREEAAASGEAMPGGGYPIKNESDLKNAIQAFGRAKDKDATKKHIIRRAKALKATQHLPADWEGSTKEKAAAIDTVLVLANDPLFGGGGLAKRAVDLADDPLFGGSRLVHEALALASDPLFGGEDALDLVAPESVVDLAKSEIGSLVIEDDAIRNRLAKGCGVVADLAYAFSSIREAQRRLVAEGMIEKDGDDAALATKLGTIASELAAVMAQKAEHEGSEAIYMTDADDITSYIIREGALEMNIKTSDLLKRHGGAKAQLGKAAHHLMKAGQAHADMMGCMGKLATMHGAFVRKAAAAAKAGEAADGFDHGAAMSLIQEAHGHATEAADHMEMAHNALGKAAGAGEGANAEAGGEANGTNLGEWGGTRVTSKTSAEMTEGEVPWYSATDPYPGKAARTGAVLLGAVPEGFVSKREADLMAENAALAARAEMLSKTPGNVFKGRVALAQTSGSANGDQPAPGVDGDMSLLMKGIDHVDANDPQSVTNATGRMIGNMLANANRFGKSVFDPQFRGQAGVRRVAR